MRTRERERERERQEGVVAASVVETYQAKSIKPPCLAITALTRLAKLMALSSSDRVMGGRYQTSQTSDHDDIIMYKYWIIEWRLESQNASVNRGSYCKSEQRKRSSGQDGPPRPHFRALHRFPRWCHSIATQTFDRCRLYHYLIVPEFPSTTLDSFTNNYLMMYLCNLTFQ